jgi:hypothetical protein
VRVLSLVLLLSHLACSSEGSPGNALSPPSAENRVPIAELPGALSELLCREYLECCSEAELVGTPVQGLDYDSCRQFFNQVYEDRLVGIPGSVERGRIKYDEVELGACLARRGEMTCEQVRAEPKLECELFVPLVAAEGQCTGDVECFEGYCDASGICRSALQLGASCATSDECSSGNCTAGVCSEKTPITACFG